VAAGQAKKVLRAREAKQAGTGVTQVEIDAIIASAEKRHRKLDEQALAAKA
jgi:hypothetical protein